MTVHLVGAGPGDPGLLTVRAADLLARAEVVVHDRLVTSEILRLAARAELIDVGKRCERAWDQPSINRLLVELGSMHSSVVRLKGGDPLLFGRASEEVAALAAAGIAYEVVAGLSSALAAPASAGISVTQRGTAACVTIVTGHREEGAAPVDWSALARTGGTIVVLMGVEQRAAIATALQQGGLAAGTPVAVIEAATRVDQHVERTELQHLAELDVRPPATIVIGPVAADQLSLVGLGCDAGAP
jgi:uroporphyrin-III C-methyltransferase